MNDQRTSRRTTLALPWLLLLLGSLATLLLWWSPWQSRPAAAEAGPSLDPAHSLSPESESQPTTIPGDADDKAGSTDPEARKPRLGTTWSIAGVVLADPLVPIRGARILVYTAGSEERHLDMAAVLQSVGSMRPGQAPPSIDRPLPGRLIADQAVGADGRFALPGLPSPHLRIQLDHAYYGLRAPEYVHARDGQHHHEVTLTPYLGGHVIGRLRTIEPDPSIKTASNVQLLAEIDQMGVMRDPQNFFANILHDHKRSADVGVDGRFEFRAVLPNQDNRILFRAPKHFSMSESFPVWPGETREIVLVAQTAAILRVRVEDMDGKPAPSAEVALAPKQGGQILGVYSGSRVHTDARGEALSQALSPGDYDLTVIASNLRRHEQDVTLKAGDNGPLVLRLHAGQTISGIVIDPKGQPIADAGVAFVPANNIPLLGDVNMMAGLDLLAKQCERSPRRSAADGTFRIGGLPDTGSFNVIANHADFAPSYAAGVRPGARDVSIRLPLPSSVRGRILDAKSGAPVPDFDADLLVSMVMGIQRPSQHVAVRKSTDGTFELTRIQSGRSTLRIQARGYATYKQKLNAAVGAQLDCGEIRLARGAILRGIVLGDRDAGIGAATVSKAEKGLAQNPILQQMVGGQMMVKTDQNGRFELTDLPAGEISITATAPGYARGNSDRITLAAGEVTEGIVLRLGHGGSIAGQLLLPAGHDTSAWTIAISTKTGSSMSGLRPDRDGAFRADNLEPGSYQVQAFQDRGMQSLTQSASKDMASGAKGFDLGKLMGQLQSVMVQQRCEVRAGQTTSLTLRHGGGPGTVELTLRITIGEQPLTQGLVEVHTPGQDLILAAIENGQARVAALEPGRITVRLRSGLTMAPIGDPQTHDVPSGQPCTLSIRLPGGRISGKVQSSSTGEPLSGALVRLVRAGAADSSGGDFGFTLTGDGGGFSFAGLQPGRYTVIANDMLHSSQKTEGGRIDNLEIDAARLHLSDILLRTTAASRARVRVLDPFGGAATHAKLLAVDEHHSPLGTLGPSFTNERGVALLGGLPPGPVRIVALSEHHAPGVSDLQQLVADRSAEFVVQLQRGPTVFLRVLDGEGRPLPQASISVRVGDHGWIPPLLVPRFDARSGTYELGRLPSGPVRIQLAAHGHAQQEFSRTITNGERVVFTMNLKKNQ